MLNKPDLTKPVFKAVSELLGGKMIDLINANKCPLCECDIKEEDFRGENDKVEYSISGLCQKCQDDAELAGEEIERMEDFQ